MAQVFCNQDQVMMSPSHLLFNRTVCKDLHASATINDVKNRSGSATIGTVTRLLSVFSRTPTSMAQAFCNLNQVGGRHRTEGSPSHLLFNRSFCRCLHTSAIKSRFNTDVGVRLRVLPHSTVFSRTPTFVAHFFCN